MCSFDPVESKIQEIILVYPTYYNNKKKNMSIIKHNRLFIIIYRPNNTVMTSCIILLHELSQTFLLEFQMNSHAELLQQQSTIRH